jgi:hypothetical protein
MVWSFGNRGIDPNRPLQPHQFQSHYRWKLLGKAESQQRNPHRQLARIGGKSGGGDYRQLDFQKGLEIQWAEYDECNPFRPTD